ncbi:MAG: hypothetical protein LBE13_20620 [Bacteroidales bacterium]|jgi:IS30 family transposase|nr:hypothetical protein [Bacteroidales bacterium]
MFATGRNAPDMKYPLSAGTIYGYLYGELKEEPELKGHFRHLRVCRKARGEAKDKRGQIPDRKLIDTRPAIVDKKIRVGDWEADTMEGAEKTAYIAAFVDKPAKLLRGKVMPDKAALNKAAIQAFRSIPNEYIKTADNGSDCKSVEFTGHKDWHNP